MVGTRFTEDESNIKINLAKVAPNGAMLQGPSSKTVFLNADGTIRFEGQIVSVEQLSNMLVQAVANYPGTAVQMKPDKDAKFQHVAEVHSAIIRSGARIDGVSVASVRMPGSNR